jgi:hypothetical protein
MRKNLSVLTENRFLTPSGSLAPDGIRNDNRHFQAVPSTPLILLYQQHLFNGGEITSFDLIEINSRSQIFTIKTDLIASARLFLVDQVSDTVSIINIRVTSVPVMEYSIAVGGLKSDNFV